MTAHTNNFLAAEPAIVQRLQDVLADLTPKVTVLTSADLAGVKEQGQTVPAVHVVWSGFRVQESPRTDGMVTDQAHNDVALGGIIRTPPSPATVTVKKVAAPAPAPVAASGNFEVRPGGIFILPDAADIDAGDDLLLTYTHPEYINTEALTTSPPELELFAIIGKFADAGIDASRAGTALNAILSQFSDPASKFREELAALGITTNNFGTALRQLASKGPDAQRAILAVGTEAGPALRSLLNQGIGALDELTGKLRVAQGSAAATAKVMEDNLVGATRSLSSAWDTVKTALTTPLLPVLRDGVERLTAALNESVANGTIAKYGEAIAGAFRAGLEWAQRFFGQVDPAALTARLQGFAAQATATFQQVGEYARNAGNVVQLVYGVMAGGANAVLTAVYGVGAAFAGVARDVTLGIATLRDAMAKVTFGKLSESFRLAANDARETAGAFGAASEAMEAKARASFVGMAAAAETARNGWTGLTQDMGETGRQAEQASKAIAFTRRQLEDMGAAATAAAAKATAAAAEQRQAVELASTKVAQLRQEYAQAIDTGNLQRAAEVMQQLRRATDEAAAAAGGNKKAQEEAALAIAQAFQNAGVRTKQELTNLANNAKSDFELIKSSGQATAEGLQAAWKRFAEAAITANGGVATGVLQAQASMYKLEIATDATGKSIVRAMGAGAQAVGGLDAGLQVANDRLQAQTEAWDRILMRYKLTADYTEAQIALLEKEIALQERRDELERKRLNVDKNGFSLDKAGNTAVAGGDLTSLTGIAAFLKSAGVADEGKARAIAREFADAQGNIPYFNNPGQLKYGGANSTMSQALLKAAERYTFGGAGGAGAQPMSTIPAQTKTVNLQLNGRQVGSVTTDAAGAASLDKWIAQLTEAAGRS